MLVLLQVFLAFSFAVFLAALASFFNVVIFRSVHEESFAKGRSHCEHCHQQIAWYDNLPVLSFLLLHGRCRSCQSQIKPIYFWTELGAFVLGLFFMWTLTQSSVVDQSTLYVALLHFLIGFVLLFALLADLQYLIVPDFLVLVFSFLVLLLHVLTKSNWGLSIGGLVFCTSFFLLLYVVAKKLLKKEALGWGDIKLMMPLSWFLAWPKIILGIFLAFIIGGIFAMLVLLTGRKKFGQALPFAPFLIIASTVTWLFGEAIYRWYWGLLF